MLYQDPHTRFLCPVSKLTFHYVLWVQRDLLIMQYQSLTWYKAIVFTSESYLIGFQIALFHLTLLFPFWDMLFSAPLFSQIAITRIFLYMPILSCIFIFIPIILKELFQNSLITFQIQIFCFQSPTLDFPAACGISPPFHFCDSIVLFFISLPSGHCFSVLFNISVPCPRLCPCPIVTSVYLLSTWPSPAVTHQSRVPCKMQACLSSCPVCPPW